jgi:hypothetical protein
MTPVACGASQRSRNMLIVRIMELMGAPKKISKQIQEEWEALPNTPENQKRRDFLLQELLKFRKQESQDRRDNAGRPKIRRKKEEPAPQAPTNPAVPALLKKIQDLETENKKLKGE